MLLGFGLGVALTTVSTSDAEVRPSPYERLNTFAKVMSYIERSYVEPVAQKDLIDAAIKGMVKRLDPHSAYLTVDEYRAFRDETDGEFVGVGLEIGMRDRYIKVVAPVDGAPAARAGVAPGDIVTAVDGDSSRGWSLRDTVKRLKGKRGTTVKLEVLRPPPTKSGKDFDITRAKRLEFVLEREVIDVVSVSAKLLDKRVGYFRVRAFQQDVAADLEAELDRLETEAGGPLAGVIIDLRNNPGGLLTEAVQLCDLFIDRGVIVSTENRGKVRVETFEARPAATRTTAPLAVLVNAGSASASEIVAGAIQDHGRGAVVGQRSFGKGSVQSIIDMKDGSGLKLTTARYFTPDHRSIQDTGITPDIVLAGKRPASTSKGGPTLDTDPQLRAAHQAILTGSKKSTEKK